MIPVKAGSLVMFQGTGIVVGANLNDPEFGRQPYVTINTDHLAAEHRYDEKTGRRATNGPFVAHGDPAGGAYVVDVSTGDQVARFRNDDGTRQADARKDAEAYAATLNTRWAGHVGCPIIAVHLNDCTIFDDEGAGPMHKADTPRTDRFTVMEDALETIRAAVNEPTSTMSDVHRIVCDELRELDRAAGISV